MRQTQEARRSLLAAVGMALICSWQAASARDRAAESLETGAARAVQDAEDPRTTRAVTVTSGGQTRTFSVADLQALPKATLAKHVVFGSKRGLVGPYSWAGAQLTDVLARVDPTIATPGHTGSSIVLTSSDGWKATLFWDELFGAVPRGAALYNIKGCNECHGLRGEGTAPAGKPAAPALAGRTGALDTALAKLRKGGDAHGGVNAYPDAQLAGADLQAILDYFSGSPTAAAAGNYVAPPERRAVLLAYEKDGRPATGADGLIQLVVGPDEAASRYGHWVKTIEVVPPAR